MAVLSKLSTLAYSYLQLQSSVIFATSFVGREFFLLLHTFNGHGLAVKFDDKDKVTRQVGALRRARIGCTGL
jgi:hypothetical protein